ncbi:disulfide bond formation protein B [Celeribacter indicus]|uniref:Disulfide bond formation-like protein n=1 Tax=Celeribacter indicus TaxID=1208324 RepID=A0A0B5DQA4_9RHOB|nr:disulfide bond formation protein B [Celeribacter indicus]AJE45718.1 disulfide bond formation-like protein [Celeribacter indicus]SDX31656.1 disulfide bond formation protein DsbB [Celeribacter indicus]
MPDLATRQTLAFLIALTATLSALFIGEVLGQMPCTLCWYQRIAMFPLVAVLGMALWSDDPRGRLYALPLALIGLVIAGYHSGLYAGLIAEPLVPCTQNGPSCTDRTGQSILGLPIPYLSLAAFAAIAILLAPKGPPLTKGETR